MTVSQGNVFGAKTGPAPTDIDVLPLTGGYAVKLTDVIFIVGGLLIGALIGGDIGLVVALIGIALAALGILVGWD